MEQLYQNRKFISYIVAANIVIFVIVCLFVAPHILWYTFITVFSVIAGVMAIVFVSDFINMLIEDYYNEEDE